MSSIFSDPFFRRGSTLLGGEKIDLDTAGNPIAGGEVVGQVKAFQDVTPTTIGTRHSNRLVYCIAARYKGSDVSDASTVAGTTYTLDGLNEFTNKTAAADVTAGKAVGVLDEYLTGMLRTNDIVWLAVKGPCSVKSTGTIAAGAMVAQSSTAGTAAVSGATGASTAPLGQAIDAAASGTCRVNLHCDFI